MNLLPEEKAEIKNAILLAATIAVWACFFGLVLCPPARADWVAALHLPPTQCAPCARMLPVEAALRAERYDIRTIDVAAHPAWASAPGRGYPRYVYIVERGGRNYYTEAKIIGECSAGQLRRLCVVPTAATVGAWTRNVWRAAFGNPVWEW